MIAALYFLEVFSRGWNWSKRFPQAIGYGALIFISGSMGIPSLVTQAFGIMMVVGGIWASVKYLRTSYGEEI